MNKEINKLLHISDGSYSVFKSENTKIGPFFSSDIAMTNEQERNKSNLGLIITRARSPYCHEESRVFVQPMTQVLFSKLRKSSSVQR